MEKKSKESKKLEAEKTIDHETVKLTEDGVVMKRKRVKKRKKKSMVPIEQPTVKKRKRKITFDDSQLIDDDFENLIIENRRDDEETKSRTKANRLDKNMEKKNRNNNTPIIVLIIVVIVGFSVIAWNQSKGTIRVPDFSQATAQEIENWAKVNQIDLATQKITEKPNQNILQSVPAGEIIEKGSKLTILVNPLSDFSNKKEMPDFTGQTKEIAEQWLKQMNFKGEFVKVYSNSVPAGQIVSQSLASGEKLKNISEVSFGISKGKEVKKMPNFSQMDLTEAKQAARENGVSLIEEFSDLKPFGQFIFQSLPSGKMLVNGSEKVVYSLGQPYITSYYGVSEGELAHKIFTEYNSKGAKVTFKTYEVYSAAPKGTVVQENICNQFIPLNQYLEFGISNGAANYWGY